MKFSLGFATLSLLLATAVVEATSLHDSALPRRHASHPHARDISNPPSARKRCKSRNIAPGSTSSANPAHSSAPHNNSVTKPQNSHLQKPAPATSGVIRVNPGKCGSIGATETVSKLQGPNGHIDWINCGVTSGGWTPPRVEMGQLITASLDSARHTAFAACSDQIIATFNKYGNQFGIPPIVLASFAMQESGCNPSTTGGAGEQGLMQITKDKCGGAPNGNCKDIDFNIKTGAQYFTNVLAQNNGDVFKTIGEYNGWSVGMTYAGATQAAHSSCCRCQNNLD
ncbi:lysozyme-like domain-containing protein [Multifurca ochricompacta]|uniref:Lysozyme-like domain-containing protein n=1 Tax=Multifurca ochricompacta TaxID=376703 RepID=A0AAD4M927_9AGAM|nr:lysozyme-like domain-containing protein [Multifurca ochricompacta]